MTTNIQIINEITEIIGKHNDFKVTTFEIKTKDTDDKTQHFSIEFTLKKIPEKQDTSEKIIFDSALPTPTLMAAEPDCVQEDEPVLEAETILEDCCAEEDRTPPKEKIKANRWCKNCKFYDKSLDDSCTFHNKYTTRVSHCSDFDFIQDKGG